MPGEASEVDTDRFAELIGKDAIELIIDVAPRKVLARIGKAADHYNKAHALIGIDEEMGAIRLIAAEEELVVAIFEWLKLNSDTMPRHQDFIGKFKNHWVKLAFHPVLSQFRFVLTDMLENGFTVDGLEDVLTFQAETVVADRKFAFRIRKDDGAVLVDVNPLSGAVTRSGMSADDVIVELYNDFAELVKEQHGGTVREFVRQRAEFRNHILYAADGGFAAMEHSLGQLLEQNFRNSLRDLLWCLGVLLTNKPSAPGYGIADQFVSLYRRVLQEAKLV